MSAIVEVADNGELRLPPSVHGWEPHTVLRATQQGEILVLGKEASASQECPATERASKFRALIIGLPERNGPEISDEALRRENLYD